MLCVELTGEGAALFDCHFVAQATKAVFHYFKQELNCQTVSVAEFERALERVLRGFAHVMTPPAPAALPPRVLESDLARLAGESGPGCDLFFFPRLRDELRHQLLQTPRILRFRGLRGCVKHLAGARRWTSRCRSLQDQIVQYLRQCLSSEPAREDFTLLVE